MHRSPESLWFCVAIFASTACADRDVLTHELSSTVSSPSTDDPSDDPSDEDRSDRRQGSSTSGEDWLDSSGADPIDEQSGNYPEPATSMCGSLPEGIDPIPGLTSAWAMRSDEPTVDDGKPTAANGLRLILSNAGLECGDTLTFDDPPNPACGEAAWWYAMTLQPELGLGTFDFDETPGLFPEVLTRDAACSGEAVGGYGEYEPSDSPVGRIEILSITEDCVVGKLHYFEFGQTDGSASELSGGFVAQRCQVDCLPKFGATGC